MWQCFHKVMLPNKKVFVCVKKKCSKQSEIVKVTWLLGTCTMKHLVLHDVFCIVPSHKVMDLGCTLRMFFYII